MRTLTLVLILLAAAITLAGPALAKNQDHKVAICHNGHDITIDRHALPAHLRHGDSIGSCVDIGEPETPTPYVTLPPAVTPAPTYRPTPNITMPPTDTVP